MIDTQGRLILDQSKAEAQTAQTRPPFGRSDVARAVVTSAAGGSNGACEESEGQSSRWPSLPPQGLGIGIITYNRLPLLRRCLEAVLRHTQVPFHVTIADDGSTDGTAAWCRQMGVPVVTGPNGGCSVNKNRALGYLLTHTDCDPIVLLEDDAIPSMDGWEADWVRCCIRYGHVNYATRFHLDGRVSRGSGTPSDPWLCDSLSGQCTITSRTELMRVGYLDSRFAGYGEEHVEWTMRFSQDWPCNAQSFLTPLLNSGLELATSNSYFDEAQRNRNLVLRERILGESVYRDPFRSDGTGLVSPAAFWAEQRQAVAGRPPAKTKVTAFHTDCFLAVAARPFTSALGDVVVTLATSELRDTHLRAMLNSLRVHGGGGFTPVVLHEEDGTNWPAFLKKYGAIGVPFRRLRGIPNAANDWFVKGLLYSVAEFVNAERYICLDCDTLILDSLAGLWPALDVLGDSNLLFAFDGNGVGLQGSDLRLLRLVDYVSGLYGGQPEDLAWLRPEAHAAKDYRLLLNSGVFAGRSSSLKRLSQTLRRMMPLAWEWLSAAPASPREQLLVNLAVADGTGLELDGTYNVQLHEPANRAELNITPDHRALWRGQPIRVLHFSGPGKNKMFPELQKYYRKLNPATPRGMHKAEALHKGALQ